jgi:hypothetical protein
MRSRLAMAFSVFTVLGSVGLARSAHAQSEIDKEQARDLGEAGFKALDAHQWAQAEDLFRRADALYHAPTLCVGLARAQAHEGKYVEAWEAYHRVITDGLPPNANDAMRRAVADAHAEIDGVAAQRSHVTIRVSGPSNPSVTIDGQPIPTAGLGVERPVDPGTHVVRATADGFEPAQATFTIGEGASTKAELTLASSAAAHAPSPARQGAAPQAVPAPPSVSSAQPVTGDTTPSHGGSSQRTLGWVVLGVGGVGLLTGAAAGIAVLAQHGSIANDCSRGSCPSSEQSTLDSYHTTGMVSNIGFIVGGVAAATGLVLLITAPRRDSGPARSAYVAPYIGLGTLGATGSF